MTILGLQTNLGLAGVAGGAKDHAAPASSALPGPAFAVQRVVITAILDCLDCSRPLPPTPTASPLRYCR